jgi:hypothetical protein
MFHCIKAANICFLSRIVGLPCVDAQLQAILKRKPCYYYFCIYTCVYSWVFSSKIIGVCKCARYMRVSRKYNIFKFEAFERVWPIVHVPAFFYIERDVSQLDTSTLHTLFDFYSYGICLTTSALYPASAKARVRILRPMGILGKHSDVHSQPY